jgi:hypothetical protein
MDPFDHTFWGSHDNYLAIKQPPFSSPRSEVLTSSSSTSIMVQTPLPILHTRSRTNSLVQPQTKSRLAVAAEPPMGCFVAQVPSLSDSLKALTRPATSPHESPLCAPFCASAPETSPYVPLHKSWWTTIRRGRSRTSSTNSSIPSLSRTHSPEPETPEPEIRTPFLRTPSSGSVSLLRPESCRRSPSRDTKSLPRLHPHLARPEKKSRLKKAITCSVCLEVGDDYPRCGKCGMAWCSRACRLQSLGQDPLTGKPLKKHHC